MLDDKDIEIVGTGLGGNDVGDALIFELVRVGYEVALIITVVNVLHDFHEVSSGLELSVD